MFDGIRKFIVNQVQKARQELRQADPSYVGPPVSQQGQAQQAVVASSSANGVVQYSNGVLSPYHQQQLQAYNQDQEQQRRALEHLKQQHDQARRALEHEQQQYRLELAHLEQMRKQTHLLRQQNLALVRRQQQAVQHRVVDPFGGFEMQHHAALKRHRNEVAFENELGDPLAPLAPLAPLPPLPPLAPVSIPGRIARVPSRVR
jgi:hypothetical protein